MSEGIKTMIDPSLEFSHVGGGPAIPDDTVYGMAKLVFDKVVGWEAIKTYGQEVFSRAQEHYTTLTNG